MKSLLRTGALCALLGTALSVSAATFTVDPSASWQGFMNIFNTGGPGNGIAGAGAFVFNSSWGTPDLRATFSGPSLSLAANTIGDPNSFWYTPSGGPGATGNKIMDANFYQQFDGTLAGTTVTFTGSVLGNNLEGPVDAALHGWTAVAFIKDFASDFSSSVATTVDLTPGLFSISLPAINDPTRHVQFGFEVIGPDVWAGDPLSFNSVVVTAVPEPAALALAGLGAAALLIRRRRN